MVELRTKHDVTTFLSTKPTAPLGLIPTMGALHEGHLSLIETAKHHCKTRFVTLFVNPTQFGPNEDFASYPRQLDEDVQKLKDADVDAVFIPDIQTLYPNGLDVITQIEVPHLANRLEGKARPGFFNGVCSVVLRLFHLIQPQVAFFGEKDFQQLQIVSFLTHDLSLDIEIIGCPIIREPNGLALSSRNTYLSANEKKEASEIFQSLQVAKKAFKTNETNPNTLCDLAKHHIKNTTSIQIDYLTCVSPKTLEPVNIAKPNDRLLFAGILGETRLIDNLAL